MTYTIFNEDAVKWAKEYDGMPFHALLSDPPYHLTSIVKRFGKKDSAPAQYGTDGVFSRSSKGFMGQTWDGGDIAFQPETWEVFSRILYPGAFGMAFSASRNWHRLAVAIEDAGFIIHPSIFGWLNGQGFPKATRVKGEKEFEGHRYGLQALKPAVEPIIVFQKPYEGRPIDNIVNTGAGALNIDGSRIPLANGDEYTINTFDDGAKPWGDGAGHKYTSRKIKEDPRLGGNGTWKTDKAAKNVYAGGYAGEDIASSPLGRWTANFILDEETAPLLNRQSGFSKSSDDVRHNNRPLANAFGKYNPDITGGYSDEGGASRFFYTVSNQIDESDPIYYTAKVSPKERNAGLEEFEGVNSAIITNSSGRDIGGKLFCQICGHRQGACKCLEPEWGYKKQGIVKNPHPTCKPISLAKYLATILLPPDSYAPRRIMVPFSGVASEMIGCLLAGWEEVVGIEFDTENGYVDIANKRLEHWLK